MGLSSGPVILELVGDSHGVQRDEPFLVLQNRQQAPHNSCCYGGTRLYRVYFPRRLQLCFFHAGAVSGKRVDLESAVVPLLSDRDASYVHLRVL